MRRRVDVYNPRDILDEIMVRVLQHLLQSELRQIQLVCRALAILVSPLLDDSFLLSQSATTVMPPTQHLSEVKGSSPAAEARLVDTEHHESIPDSPSQAPQPKPLLSSIPTETRFQIYRYLKPVPIYTGP